MTTASFAKSIFAATAMLLAAAGATRAGTEDEVKAPVCKIHRGPERARPQGCR